MSNCLRTPGSTRPFSSLRNSKVNVSGKQGRFRIVQRLLPSGSGEYFSISDRENRWPNAQVIRYSPISIYPSCRRGAAPEPCRIPSAIFRANEGFSAMIRIMVHTAFPLYVYPLYTFLQRIARKKGQWSRSLDAQSLQKETKSPKGMRQFFTPGRCIMVQTKCRRERWKGYCTPMCCF